MAKHVIFLVHGMGPFLEGWSESTKKQIRDSYSAFSVATSLPFDLLFQFKEITYNNRFEQIRKRWKNDTAAVLHTLKKGGIEKGIATELTKANTALGAENFLSTHVLDVVLYKLTAVREAIKTQVSTVILDTLLDDPSDVPRWSIIGHSLGTAVTHDSLHAMFTQTVPGDNRTLLGRTKADVVMLMANVSRVLEEKAVDVYTSATRPGKQPDAGVCRYFINAKHEWDPIPRVKEFRPLDDWPDVETRNDKRFVPVKINAIQSKDVHAMSHYLANPKVHGEFFKRVLPSMDLIPDAEITKVSGHFEGQTPFAQFEALQEQLKKLQDPTETGTLADVVKNAVAFVETLKQF